MTDYPRFQLARHTPEEAYLHHHGAPVVRAVFRMLDWWLARREVCTHRAERVSQARDRVSIFIQQAPEQ